MTSMADELQLTDMERVAVLQLVQLSEGETTTTASATSSSSSCGGSVTFIRPEINTNSVGIENVVGDNDGKKRRSRKEGNHDQKRKRRKEDNFDGDEDNEGETVIRSKITKRYRCIMDIYKATMPLIS